LSIRLLFDDFYSTLLSMSQIIQGTPASPGIAIGPAWVYRPVRLEIERRPAASPADEWQRLQTALHRSLSQLAALQQRAAAQVGAEEAAIFEAHRLMLQDPELLDQLEAAVAGQGVNAEAAVQDALEGYAALLAALPGEYQRARAGDVRDVARRVLAALRGVNLEDAARPSLPSIILADDLTPSDTVRFERGVILAFCTRRGGPTAHTAILARALGVPAVVSAPLDLDQITPGEVLIVDGSNGTLTRGADAAALAAARARQAGDAATWQAQLAGARHPVVTLDGARMEVAANIGSLEDALDAVRFGADGVGLLRTEFLYLGRDSLPGEDEQAQTYRAIFAALGARPVVVRTLDIGGDKSVPYLGIRAEANPFLGWRAIRMLDERPDVLLSQLRALLRAGAGVDLRIMLPLVSRMEEVRQARALLEQARAELDERGEDYAQAVQFGMMVEVPSAALLAGHFAQEVDFFSIGSNDLAQYTLAVDRTNERVAALASPLHPGVLQLMDTTIRAAHRRGRWVGLCGELAADPLAAPLLLGLGLDELSMAPRAVPHIKQVLRGVDRERCRALAGQALAASTTAEVERLLRAFAL
jgi:phosphoenolpyruvate-protein phosphotransferase